MIRLQKNVIFICNSKREFRFFLTKKTDFAKKNCKQTEKIINVSFLQCQSHDMGQQTVCLQRTHYGVQVLNTIT